MSYLRRELRFKPHWVYRLYDENNRLLYVGCTSRHPITRLHQLSGERAPVARASYVRLEAKLFQTGAEAVMEEGRLIDALRPPYNTARSGVGLRREAGLPV